MRWFFDGHGIMCYFILVPFLYVSAESSQLYASNVNHTYAAAGTGFFWKLADFSSLLKQQLQQLHQLEKVFEVRSASSAQTQSRNNALVGEVPPGDGFEEGITFSKMLNTSRQSASVAIGAAKSAKARIDGILALMKEYHCLEDRACTYQLPTDLSLPTTTTTTYNMADDRSQAAKTWLAYLHNNNAPGDTGGKHDNGMFGASTHAPQSSL